MGQTPFTPGYPTTLPSASNLGNGANNAKSTLNGTITSGATTLIVASAATFPAAPFPLTINNEIVIVTAKSGTTFTVTRGAFGTSAASHSTGATVNLNVVWGYHSVLESEVINTATLLGTNATQTHPISGSIFIGASSSANKWAVPTGDVAMDNTGAFTITNKLSTNTARTTIVGTTAATMTNPRDVQVDGKIAYVTNFGANQVNLYDVSIPASPTLISTISDADLNAPRQTQVQGKYLYVANQSGNSYTVFDITNPKLPVKLVTKSGGSIAAPGGIYVRGKYLYLTGTATGAQFTIFDNTNPAVPIELGSYTPPSGEKFGRCSFQSKYAYCPLQSSGPFTDDGLYIINISNSSSPSLTGRYLINGIGTTGAPVDSSIIGNVLYMLDEGGGMRVIDVTDPTTIVQLGYTTSGIEGGSTGMWAQGRYVYVGAQINNTVVAYDVITPASPVVVSTSAATLNVPSKLTVIGRYLYVVNRGSGTMSIVDLGQDDIAQLKAGAVQADYVSSTNGLRAGYGEIDGDFSVGRTARFGDNVSVNGNVAINGTITSGIWNGTAIGDTYISSAATWNAKQPAGNYITALTGDVSATGPGSVAGTVNAVGGSSAANVHAAELLANAATNLNIVGTIVKRDGSGNFTAGTITGSLTGLASLNEVPLTFSTGLTRTTNTVTVNTSQNIATLSNLTANGFVKTSGAIGTLSIDTNTYLTGNQTVTLSGDVTGSGATSITTVLANVPSGTPHAGSSLFTNIAVPGTPASGKTSVFVDSTTKTLKAINDAGTLSTTVIADAGASNNFLTAISAGGVISKAQPSFTNLSGSLGASQFPILTGDITTAGGALATTLKNTGTAGTYRSVTFDAQGRETSGTNPTTFSGYAISDNSAGLIAALTDETGSGLAVFNNAPTITSPTIAKLANLTTNGMLYTSGGNGTLNTAANVTTDGNSLTVTNNANAGYSLFGQLATNLPIPVNGSNDLVASFIDTSTSGAKVALSGVLEWQGTSNSSGNYNGGSFTAGTSTASNANLTAAGPTGGLIANNSSLLHNGSGVVTYAGVFNGRVRSLGTGSITTGYTFQSQNLSIAAATTTTEFDDFVVAGGSVAGTITTRYGYRVKSLVSGTTRWGFYSDVDPSFFGGNVTFNAPAILKSYIVSGLPSASTSGAGAMAYVTDSTATAITGLGLAVVGSGANKVMVVSDGTSWIVQ